MAEIQPRTQIEYIPDSNNPQKTSMVSHVTPLEPYNLENRPRNRRIVDQHLGRSDKVNVVREWIVERYGYLLLCRARQVKWIEKKNQ